jgi:sugar lactone lactonase YvrE
VADAGGNTVLDVDRDGHITTIAAFPDTMVQVPGAPEGTLMPMQFVPPSAGVGPRHEYYVSQLTGFPFPKGGATIWRLEPGHAPTAYATGLTNVTDLAFAHDGSLYAVEISAEGLLTGPIGALVRIPPGGGTAETVVGGLFAPYGIALRGDDAYVTTGSVLPGGGQVIKIALP